MSGKKSPTGVDLQALDRTKAVIAGLTNTYLEWARKDLDKLQAAYGKLAAGAGSQKEEMEAIFRICHDIKGQGGSFGYDLMTFISDSLCRFIDKREFLEGEDVDVIKAHIDALKLVIARNLSGRGGLEGDELRAGVELAMRKHKNSQPTGKDRPLG